MRDKYDKLMELLAEKTLSFGCRVKVKQYREDVLTYVHSGANGNYTFWGMDGDGTDEYNTTDITNILGYPVTIGRVLEKILFMPTSTDKGADDILGCVGYWGKFGFTRPLNDVEWKNLECICPKGGGGGMCDAKEKFKPTDKNAEELLNYLFKIFNI